MNNEQESDISVIVPVYNSEKYLAKCVDSILNQDFRNFELILIDDGSTDGGGRICDEYSKKDNRVRVIHQKNMGLSAARNEGIRESTAPFIAFCDSDDYLSPRYLSSLYNLLKNSDCDFSVCSAMRLSDDGENTTQYSKVNGKMSNVEFFKAQILKRSEFGAWNKLYRREIFDKVKYYCGKHNEDVIFSCDLVKNFNKNGVIATNETLYFYCWNERGIIANQKLNADPDFVFAASYLTETAKLFCPQVIGECLRFTLNGCWNLVDRIYVHKTFKKNREFLNSLREYILKYEDDYRNLDIDDITRKRVLLFAKSPKGYFLNASARLFRVYLYRVLNKDAYADGHGI